MEGTDFPAETVFRATVRDGTTNSALGYVTFSVYFESGAPVTPEAVAGALQARFGLEGLSLDQFLGLRPEPLDWPVA
jgi:hypothetical protein